MKAKSAIPVLRSFSEDKMREFYLDFLGFRIDWQHRFEESAPAYTQIALGKCKLHISEHHGDAAPGSRVFIRCEGLRDYQASLLAKNYVYARPGLEETPWGALEMTIDDPFGNRVTFSEEVD